LCIQKETVIKLPTDVLQETAPCQTMASVQNGLKPATWAAVTRLSECITCGSTFLIALSILITSGLIDSNQDIKNGPN
jgi:hypothetical protein